MTQPGTLAFNECCQRVIRAAKKVRAQALIHYAQGYAEAGLKMTDRDEIRVQSLYILNNLSGWRGDEARMVKTQLREFANEK